MPKETFYNLKESKQDQIIDAAIKEFAQNYFDSASLTQIASQAGVSKGSMYQYFEDKKELYFYVLERIRLKRKNYFAEGLNKNHDVMAILRRIFEKGLYFARDNPLLVAVWQRYLHEQNLELKQMIDDRLKYQEGDYFIHLIEEAQAQGQVRTEIPASLIARMIYQINQLLMEEIDLNHLMLGDREKIEEYQRIIEDLLEMLARGILS